MNNVLLDCERTKYPNTGLFQFCLQLGNELIKQHDPQRESLFFYLPPEQRQLFGSNQQVVPQHHLHKFFQFGTGKFQVWHNTFQNSNYKPYNHKTRVVLTVNDLNFLVESKYDEARIKKYLQHVQKNVDRADHIVCISEYTKKIVLEHLSINKPIEVIYDGYDTNEFPDFDKPVYKPTKKFIFSIGTVVPKKNFHVLPALLKNNDYELVVAGNIDKAYSEKIIETAKLHGVADRVILTGPVSEENKYWYFTNCLAFAFPSLAEGFGLPVVEAMHYGKPVFISRLTSLPEIGGDLAYYFEDNFEAAGMQQVFEKGMQHYHDTGAATIIQQRAQQFNWVNTAKSYLKVYRTLYK